ncbi:MAG: glycoside hydrolase family 97 protein [Akkermansiaceae bacterium]|jgi:alpha-glucosidase|nr:glycoside hydrolase family 97 protein [Akkermansiaceae bacterium]MDP4722564.1 glycoside hydrolase family 97 protein [Akkermansiaceae bacterium]MDP4779293.1 glycoside hydrolase family 97 protein [Akkermansiaceae bacterium]MDP4845956.1 glycoside hydrolase family 97 protein [Akkermansiaceae bacterium]MDP4897341.1 glycoside hydrolase family 97 protein [Akkermansiaceae bacterium]
MTSGHRILISAISISALGSIHAEETNAATLSVSSPDGQTSISFVLAEQGAPTYSVSYDGKPILLSSALGVKLKGDANLTEGFAIGSTSTSSKDETWKPLTGERSEIRDHYNELTVDLKKDEKPALQIKFRAYDEGIAFRYVFPEETGSFTITEELTQFSFADDHFCWDTKDPQHVYQRVPISKAGRDIERPLVVEVGDSPFVALGEARMVDYARLRYNTPAANTFGIELGSDVVANAPYASPWRYIMIGDTPGELLENNDLLVNLNDPCAIEDTSWIKPGKVIRSELNTKVAKETIDWAVEMNAGYILLDAGWYGNEMDNKSDATTVTIDPKRYSGELDMQAVIDYGKQHDIGVIVYVNRRALEKQLDELLPLFQEWGIAGIKFGFVNVGSQHWTNWMHDAVKKCAEYKMIVDIHDDYRPTGWSRTYPNLLTQEGVHGNEEMPTAKDNVLLPFTRFLCGAADYTVCYYSSRVQATRAHQLAASIVYYSPIQLIFWYDKPSQFKNEPELDVFKQVPTIWDDTKVLHGEMEKFVSIARRTGDKWFIGTMNAGEPRKLEIKLDFLKPGINYTADIKSDTYPDGSDRTKVTNSSKTVTSESVLTADMAHNGGQAIILTPEK